MDQLGYRGRIGLVVPSTNTVVQPESDALRPLGVTNHTARITIVERKITGENAFLDHVAAMRDGMSAAVEQVATCGPTHVIMGVALEAFWGGVETADQLQHDLSELAGVGVSMGSTAMVAALRAVEKQRIAVLTPHQPKGDEQVAAYFEEAGFDIQKLIGLKCESPRLIAHTPKESMLDAIKELDGANVEAIVQVGTNLPMLRIAAAAELWLNKPVLSINAVTYWDALRRSGIDDKVAGCGRILEEF